MTNSMRKLMETANQLFEDNVRLVDTLSSENGALVVKIYFDTEWEEYQVHFYGPGFDENATYHTDDKDDAYGTAKVELNRFRDDEDEDVLARADMETNRIW